MVFKRNKQKGFSLVELMIVVGIIGILSALAIPQFSAFQARARQAEARATLSHIYTLQQSFFSDQNRYAGFTVDGLAGAAVAGPYGYSAVAADQCYNNNDAVRGVNGLGFNLPCPAGQTTARYAYIWNVPAAALTTFTATASSNPGFTPFAAPFNTAGGAATNLIVPNCNVPDVFTIDENKDLRQRSNSISGC